MVLNTEEKGFSEGENMNTPSSHNDFNMPLSLWGKQMNISFGKNKRTGNVRFQLQSEEAQGRGDSLRLMAPARLSNK